MSIIVVVVTVNLIAELRFPKSETTNPQIGG